MITVKTLLESKKKGFWSISPDTTAYEALHIMAGHDVGALLVVNGCRLLGIFTERDYSRKVVLRGRSSKDTPVGELMTANVCCVGPDDSIDRCMVIMNEMQIRHLPVVDSDEPIGIVSIRNLIDMVIMEKELSTDPAEKYIYD